MNMLSLQEKHLLFKATRSGDLTAVENFIQKGGTEQKNEFGWTPLMLAALWGHLEIVEYLVSQKANLEAKSKMGITAIMLAALQKRNAVVNYLLKFQKKLDQHT